MKTIENVFKNMKLLCGISNNWRNNLLGTNVYYTLESCWLSFFTVLQWTNTNSVIYKWVKFSPFLSLVIFFLAISNNITISSANVLDNILS